MGRLGICPACGLKILPIHERCVFCAKPLRTPEEALFEEERWEALDPSMRRDVVAEHERDLGALRAWRRSLDGRRGMHAAVGSFLFGAPMTTIYLFWWNASAESWMALAALAFLIGGVAGYALNRFGGGRRRGVAVFLGAFLVIFAVTLATRAVQLPVDRAMIEFTWRALAYGAFVSTAGGYALGSYVVFERGEA